MLLLTKTLKFLIRKCYHSRFIHSRTVLGIETSCDETGIAIVDENGEIISDVCNSQLQIHLDNGGIIPPIARLLHKSNIDSCVRLTLEKANIKPQELSAIAVTIKPGLPLSLIIGKNYAKTLAIKYSKPLIPIHHMEAHALTALMEYHDLNFPFLTLLISGGHCLIAAVKGINDFVLLAKSLDDAPGDILDKAARRLKLKNLGEPFNRISGGAAIELIAKSGNSKAYFVNDKYAFPTTKTRTSNFSFAQMCAKVQKKIEKLEDDLQLDPDKVLPQAADIAASLQRLISMYIIRQLQRVLTYIQWYNVFDGHAINLVISGGCACNNYITSAIKNYCQTKNIKVYIPRKELCTDNGIMIAWNGVLKLKNESQFPDLIKKTEDEINQVDIQGEAILGEDITSKVSMQGIRFYPIDFEEAFKNLN